MENVISICDREADVYDYMVYKKGMEQRFVVRAWQNRKTRTMEEEQLFDTLKDWMKVKRIVSDSIEQDNRPVCHFIFPE